MARQGKEPEALNSSSRTEKMKVGGRRVLSKFFISSFSEVMSDEPMMGLDFLIGRNTKLRRWFLKVVGLNMRRCSAVCAGTLDGSARLTGGG